MIFAKKSNCKKISCIAKSGSTGPGLCGEIPIVVAKDADETETAVTRDSKFESTEKP